MNEIGANTMATELNQRDEIDTNELLKRIRAEQRDKDLIQRGVREVIQYVRYHQADVTFYHVSNLLYDLGMPTEGNFALLVDNYENLCVWANMSWQFCATMRLVMKSGQVAYQCAPAAVYKPAARALGLPLVTDLHDYDRLSLVPTFLVPTGWSL